MKLPTPVDIANTLNNEGFTEDQANTIAAEIYQPLKDSIEDVKAAISAITVGLSGELGWDVTTTILNDLNGDT